MTDQSLVDRLSAHRALANVPRPELEWLVARGTIRHYASGEYVTRKGNPLDELLIVLQGHWAIHVDRELGPRKAMEWGQGDITGVLPFSRMRHAPKSRAVREYITRLPSGERSPPPTCASRKPSSIVIGRFADCAVAPAENATRHSTAMQVEAGDRIMESSRWTIRVRRQERDAIEGASSLASSPLAASPSDREVALHRQPRPERLSLCAHIPGYTTARDPFPWRMHDGIPTSGPDLPRARSVRSSRPVTKEHDLDG